MKITREVKIGFLVVMGLGVLIWGLNFLKGNNLFYSGDAYYGIYNRVDGLSQGSPVFYKGFKVGSVRDIVLHPTRKGLFQVALAINHDLDLNENSVAQIYSMDLMGAKGIQILEASGEYSLHPGDTILTSVMGDIVDQLSMEVLPLKEKTERLIVKLDSVLTDIGTVFSVENRNGLSYTIMDLQRTMHNVAELSANLNASLNEEGVLGKSITNLEQFTDALQMQRANLDLITANLAGFTSQLNQSDLPGVIESADSTLNTLNGLLQKASQGEGSLGLLLGDESLYLNMQDATANLDRLLADIRHNPERYLHFSAVNFGRKVYVNTDETLAAEKGIIFKVKIAESEEPLEIRNTTIMEDFQVFEDTDGDRYFYTVGETRSIAEAFNLCEKLKKAFPSATVISLREGKPIRLKKALRKINFKN